MSGLTLDAGALIALERMPRRLVILLDEADRRSTPITIPATALAQAVRAPARPASLFQLLKEGRTQIVDLDYVAAVAIGRRLAAAGTSDVVDAHVAITAEARGDAIVTSDPDDINRLVDSGSDVVVIGI